ncbi:MAG: tetratricopeptide repeat protein [Bacteroidia bacterium]
MALNKKNSCFYIMLIAFMLTAFKAGAQEEKRLLREGNDSYHGGKYKESEQYYLKAINKKQNYLKAQYNLGDSYYKQGKFSEAAGQFDNVISSSNNHDTLSKAFHNLGNANLRAKKYEDAVKAYKNSLKFSPKDEDTRYNLAYALQKMKEQQEQQKKDDQQKKDQQNKDDQKKQDKEDVNNKKDQEKQEAKQNQMSKEEAQRMLDALKNAEKKLQATKKIKGNKEAEKKNVDKDW